MITSGLEDYLELIYNKLEKGEDIKAIDIANIFNVSRPSVSEALIRLADLDLIIYEGRKGIKATPKGAIEAKRIINNHRNLYSFFTEILGVDEETANKNACRIEHVIDKTLLERLNLFSNFCKNQNINVKFKESLND